MIAKVDQLIQAVDKAVNEPWTSTLSGQERVWFLVYDPAEQRKVSLRIGAFETSTIRAGKKWQVISMKSCFPEWMSKHDYRDEYFTNPEYIVYQLEAEFIPFAIQFLKEK